MTDKELMQQALDALIKGIELSYSEYANENYFEPVVKALRARLAQPEPEPVAKMREMLEVQGRDGTWNYSPYLRGMYNGMEFMLALVEDREPVYRDEPEKYLSAPPQREWQRLTDEEVHIIIRDAPLSIFRAIEAKLREKNT